jgi:valyl-tRNA synthetase
VALVDRWIFSRLARATAQVNDAFEHFRFHEAAHVVYHFFWGDFCDWYIEWVKPELTSPDREKAQATWKNLFAALESALRLLHPFMPFLTEELWHQLPQRAGARSIALDRFPEPRAELLDAPAEEQIALLQEIIGAVRNIRAEMKIDKKAKIPTQIAPSDATQSIVENNLRTILRLANLSDLSFAKLPFDSPKGAIRSTKDFELYIPLGGQSLSTGFAVTGPQVTGTVGTTLIATLDVQVEVARLRKELDRLTKDIASKQARLEDQTFRSRAPEHIVKGMEITLAERRTEFDKLGERLSQLESSLGAGG